MRNSNLYILAFLVCMACADTKKENSNVEKGARDTNTNSVENKQYQSKKFQLQATVPPQYTILESKLPGDVPVLNFYAKNTTEKPPFAYHEKPKLSYIAVMPEGFGTELPNGKRQPVKDWDQNLEVGFAVDQDKSTVFLLENGQAWAYLLKPSNLPKSWSAYGSIFVHFGLTNFKSKCFTQDNTEKPMEECEVLGGTDRVALYGNLKPASKDNLKRILKSIKIIAKEEVKTPISNLIKVEKPLPNIEVTSPLKVEGKARGYWFFEATAGLRMEDKDGKILANSTIKARESWTTEEFVPFTGTIKFDAPNDERGYLIFERANPSGKPENKREYKLPVIFPPR